MTTSNSRVPEDADAGDPRARARRDHRGDRRQGRASLASMSAIGSPSRLCCLVTRHLPGRPLPPVRRPADLFLHPVVEHAGLWGAYAQYMYLAPNTIVHKMDKTCRPSSRMFNPLGAGFRWAVEISQTQVTTRSSSLGPGQRGLASVMPRGRRVREDYRDGIRRRPEARLARFGAPYDR